MKAKIGKIIELKKIVDPRGNLTVTEEKIDVPFEIRRVYWVYDVPSGESRGGHAHKQCRELIVAISGSFHVTLDNGTSKETYLLNHPYQGLVVETGIWRTLDDFSSGAVCLVLASDLFEEEDYIREYDEFLKSVAPIDGR
ncbi:MAG: WxcM-like domain-containing protein [Prevotella sp.]|nr:WxcM-like domain-containing protein [Prevotella sp.]